MSEPYLIVKRNLYFRPDSRGYTGIRDEAGRYTYDEAKVYLGGECQIVPLSEAPEFLPAAYHDLVIKHLIKQRDEAVALAMKLNGGEELQSLMKLNNQLAAQVEGVRAKTIEECARSVDDHLQPGHGCVSQAAAVVLKLLHPSTVCRQEESR